MIKHINFFTRVAETGSFSAVANEFSVSQPTVSKAIQALENDLNLKLFNRNTRGLTLTEEGEAAYTASLRLLEAYESLKASSQAGATAKGMVKIAAPMALGSLHILPKLKSFLAEHPILVVELKLNDTFADLIGDGIDIAVRVGEVKDSRLAVKPVGLLRRELVASSRYLATYGEPTTPADLENHSCIVHGTQYNHRQWALKKNGKKVTVGVSGNLIVDNILGIRSAVSADLGIALVGKIMVTDLIAERKVRPILRDNETDPLPVNILFPHNKFVPIRVRTVIDFLFEILKEALAV